MLVILFMEDSFQLFIKNDFLADERIEFMDELFLIDEDSNENGFIGFFDWLRAKEEHIIGFRMFFLSKKNKKTFTKFKYINNTDNENIIELFFSQKHSYLPNLSGDQDFTNNFFYKSTSDKYLLTFGLDSLSKKEFESIIKYQN